MARTTALLKNKRKAAPKAAADATLQEKSSPAPAPSPTKPSKPLKRKKGEAEEDVVPAPAKEELKPAKKAKTEESTAKPSKPTKPILVASKEEKGKPSKSKSTEKPGNTKDKPVSSSSKAGALLSSHETPKKPKPTSDLPKSISRPIPSKTKPKPGKKAKEPTPEPASEEEADQEAKEVSEEDEDEDHLHGFSSEDDEDSSDEDDDMNLDESTIDVGKLPTIAKDDETVKRKLEKAKKQPTEDRGVLYIGRLPHGFYEDQLKAYFSQFGDVTRLRISRNKKTGKSKHYAFLEFDSSAVAQIVADTMDNYLLMGHILRCKVIPKEEVHAALWVGANRKWRKVPLDRVTRVNHNKERTEEEQKRAARRLIKRQEQKKQRLSKMGINYDLDAVSYKMPKQVTV